MKCLSCAATSGHEVATMSDSALFCSHCWRRHLLWLAGIALNWTRTIYMEEGRDAWLYCVTHASDAFIILSWCSIPTDIRAKVDSIDRRSIYEQIAPIA